MSSISRKQAKSYTLAKPEKSNNLKDSYILHSQDYSGKSSKSKEILSELTTYINSISQEYSANFGIIHSNLVEFKLMLDSLFESSITELREIIPTLPRKSGELLMEYKHLNKQKFSKIFKFLEKFLNTLHDFSSENVNFDKFSEIPDNSSSFHEIRDDDFEQEFRLITQENEVLKEQVNRLEDKLMKINEYCESLIKEIETQRNTSNKLKKIIEILKKKEVFKEKSKSSGFVHMAKEFEKHLTNLSGKIAEKEEKLDDLEGKFEDFEDLKSSNNKLFKDLQNLTTEYEKIRKLHQESSRRIEELEKKNIRLNENCSEKSLNSSKTFTNSVKSTEKSDNEGVSRLPKLKNSKTLTVNNSLPEVDECEKLKNEGAKLKQEVSELKEVLKSISDELGTGGHGMLEKIIEIKQDYNYATYETGILKETLEELEKYAKTSSSKLLSYIQNNEKACKFFCTKMSGEFGKMIEIGFKKIEDRFKVVEGKMKNICLWVEVSRNN